MRENIIPILLYLSPVHLLYVSSLIYIYVLISLWLIFMQVHDILVFQIQFFLIKLLSLKVIIYGKRNYSVENNLSIINIMIKKR